MTSTKLSLRRWELGAAAFVLLLAAVSWHALAPLGKAQWRAFIKLRVQLAFLGRAEQLPHDIAAADKNIARLDSLLNVFADREPFEDSRVLEKVYAIADSSRFTISEVRIGEPVYAGERIDYPVLVNGEGNYLSVGKFVEGIESMNHSIRVRQLTLNRREQDSAFVVCDFVVTERAR